jgi:V-type H+-transporting ATPase 16kDa proteolipid subunit
VPAQAFVRDFSLTYLDIQCLIPVVMSGIIAVYSLVISVLIAEDLKPPSDQSYALFTFVRPFPYYTARSSICALLTYSSAFLHLGSGIAVGMTGLAAGYTIGVVGDKGVRAYMEQSRIFVGMVLILIFGEVLGLYGYVYVATTWAYWKCQC